MVLVLEPAEMLVVEEKGTREKGGKHPRAPTCGRPGETRRKRVQDLNRRWGVRRRWRRGKNRVRVRIERGFKVRGAQGGTGEPFGEMLATIMERRLVMTMQQQNIHDIAGGAGTRQKLNEDTHKCGDQKKGG